MSKNRNGVELEFLYSKMGFQKEKKDFKWPLNIHFQVNRNITLLLAILGPTLIAIFSSKTWSVKINKGIFVTIARFVKPQRKWTLTF